MVSELEVKDKIEQVSNIKVAPFRKNIRKTSPHKHNNYFEIVYLSRGSGLHTIDEQQYSITPPVVFVIRKEQVHFWEIENEPEGFVLIVKKSFADETLDREMKQLLSRVTALSCFFPKDVVAIEQLFQYLTREYSDGKPYHKTIVEGLLKALLAKLLQSAESVPPAKRPGENLMQQFRELLSGKKKPVNNVAHYAALMHTTPQNLNAVCQKEGKQSATQILAEYIIGEAKRLLLYTDLTVTEISYALNFKDNSHFTKYFKRHTGTTPNAYRHPME